MLQHRGELAVVQARLQAVLTAETLEERRDGRVAVDRDEASVAAQPLRE